MHRPKSSQALLIAVVFVVVGVLGTVLVMSFQRATGPQERTDLLKANPAPAGAQR